MTLPYNRKLILWNNTIQIAWIHSDIIEIRFIVGSLLQIFWWTSSGLAPRVLLGLRGFVILSLSLSLIHIHLLWGQCGCNNVCKRLYKRLYWHDLIVMSKLWGYSHGAECQQPSFFQKSHTAQWIIACGMTYFKRHGSNVCVCVYVYVCMCVSNKKWGNYPKITP